MHSSYALAPDAAAEGLAEPLATCLFSKPHAAGLFEAQGTVEPEAAAADLISLLEGLPFDRLYGARSLRPLTAVESVTDLREPVLRWLRVLS